MGGWIFWPALRMMGRIADGAVVCFSLQPLNAPNLGAFLEIPGIKSSRLLL